MSGSSKKTNTQQNTGSTTATTTQTPWSPAQQTLVKGLGDANAVYNSGVGSQVYTGQTAIPYSQQTVAGMTGAEGAAKAAIPAFQQAFQGASAAANNGGFDPLQQESVARLQKMANGDYLQGNPYVDEMIAKNAANITGANALQASANGRYGSGGYQGVTDNAVGDMARAARMEAWNTERGYQQDAIGSVYNAGQQRYSNQLAAPGALAGAYAASQAPYGTLMDIGGMYEDLATRQKNDELRIFQGQQDQPWNQINRLMGVATGVGGMGGTTTGTTASNTGQSLTAQGPSRLSGALGGAIGGGTAFGAPGALAGGLLGFLQ